MQVDETGTIRLIGELDIAGSEAMNQALALVDGAPALRIDVRDVTFVDSAGLSILLRCARRGRDVVLIGASDAVARLLEFTGTADLFQQEP